MQKCVNGILSREEHVTQPEKPQQNEISLENLILPDTTIFQNQCEEYCGFCSPAGSNGFPATLVDRMYRVISYL